MIYTPFEYSVKFPWRGKLLSAKTIIRRCENDQLPDGHIGIKKTGGWIIEVIDEPSEIQKTETIESTARSLNRMYYNLR